MFLLIGLSVAGAVGLIAGITAAGIAGGIGTAAIKGHYMHKAAKEAAQATKFAAIQAKKAEVESTKMKTDAKLDKQDKDFQKSKWEHEADQTHDDKMASLDAYLYAQLVGSEVYMADALSMEGGAVDPFYYGEPGQGYADQGIYLA